MDRRLKQLSGYAACHVSVSQALMSSTLYFCPSCRTLYFCPSCRTLYFYPSCQSHLFDRLSLFLLKSQYGELKSTEIAPTTSLTLMS